MKAVKNWPLHFAKLFQEDARRKLAKSREIGRILYKPDAEHVACSPLIIGNRYSILLQDRSYKHDIGTFHTHPDHTTEDYSAGDISSFIECGHTISYLGFRGEISYIRYSQLPKPVKDRISEYEREIRPGYAGHIMRKLIDDFNKYRKFI